MIKDADAETGDLKKPLAPLNFPSTNVGVANV